MYETIRALPYAIAIVMRLNQPVEMKPVTPLTALESEAPLKAAPGNLAKKAEPPKATTKK